MTVLSENYLNTMVSEDTLYAAPVISQPIKQLDKLQDELSVTQAKLSSLQDSVRAYATNLIDLTDANAKSSNTLAAADIQIACGNAKNDDFQVVTRRGRRQHGDVSKCHNRQDDCDVGERHNQQAEVQPSGETSVCPVMAPVSVAPSGGQSSEHRRRSPAGPQRKSYAGALRERLPDTVVIGTSLVRGVGARLHQRGIDSTVYSFPGAQLPLIRNRLDNILVPGKIPKNIVIQAAGNDVGHQRTDLVVREFEKLIQALKSRCPHSKIWLCTIPRRSQLSWLHSEIAKVNTFLEKSFHGKNVKFINSCPEFGPRYFMEDMVHFNYNGVQLYGDKIACSIINFHVNQANHYH